MNIKLHKMCRSYPLANEFLIVRHMACICLNSLQTIDLIVLYGLAVDTRPTCVNT